MGEPLQGARGHPYLFECVVARDKNDAGESTESMCHGATTTENLFHPHRHLAEIVEEKRKIWRRNGRIGDARVYWVHAGVCRAEAPQKDDIYVSIDWVPPPPATAPGTFISREIDPGERERFSLGRFAPPRSRIDECKRYRWRYDLPLVDL